MSSFKADPHLSATRCNDDSSSSDEDIGLLEGPVVAGSYLQWLDENLDALAELHQIFKESGNTLFGRSFFQFGDKGRFFRFIYRYTHP